MNTRAIPHLRKHDRSLSRDSGYYDNVSEESYSSLPSLISPIFTPDQFQTSAGLKTPDNSSFYAKNPYSNLDPERQEIRLLKVFPQRLRIYDIPRIFPQWNIASTDPGKASSDAYKLLRKLDLVDPRTVSAPRHSPPYRYHCTERDARDLPPGWSARRAKIKIRERSK
jgi:hypothetical protein